MHGSLWDLMEKYVAKQVGSSSLVDNLLNSMDLKYNREIMMVPLTPKFKVPQIDLYYRSKDPEVFGELQSPYHLTWIPKRDHVLDFPFNPQRCGERVVRESTDMLYNQF